MKAPGRVKAVNGFASLGAVLTLLASIALSVIPLSAPALADPPRPPAVLDDGGRQRELQRQQAILMDQKRQAELQRSLRAAQAIEVGREVERQRDRLRQEKVPPPPSSSTRVLLQACNDATPQEALAPASSMLVGKGWITKNRGQAESLAHAITVELSVGGVVIANAERFFSAPAQIDHPVLGRVWITRWEYPLTIATSTPIAVSVSWTLDRRLANSAFNEDGTPLRPQDFSVALSCTLIPAVWMSGRITGAGAALPDGRVAAHHAISGVSRAGADANANGEFNMLLRPGSYKFFFFSLAGPWVPEWWDNKPNFSEATSVTLVFGTTPPSLVVDLEGGVFVRGRVTDAATGGPVPGAGVLTFDAAAPCCALAFVSTDADGEYQVVSRMNVSLKVNFSPPAGSALLGEWYHGKASFDAADVVLVGSSDVPNIDAALTRGLFLRGRVTDAVSGDGVGNVGVSAQNVDGPCCETFYATTAADGNYAIALRPGVTVKVGFFPMSTEVAYLGEYWNDRPRFDLADSVTVGSADVTGINAVLERGVFVRGRVTDAATGAGLHNAFINAFVVDASCCEYLFSVTDAAGDYALAVRRNVDLKVAFFAPFASDLLQEYYNDKPDFGSADLLHVGETAIPGINAALEHGVLLSGRVVDSAGAGVSGVGVAVETETCCSATYSTTLADGSYSLPLRAGRYKVRFDPPTGSGLLSEYYDNKPDSLTANVVVVGTAAVIGINATLERGVLISGRVTIAGSTAGAANVFVSIQTAECCVGVTGTQTFADGTYSVAVRPGSYKVGFFPTSTSDLLYEFYDNVRDVFAADVLVVEAAPLTGIDATLERGVRISGRVSDVDGSGVPNVNVNLSDPTNGFWMTGTVTSFDGTYSMIASAGSYKVDFSPQPSSGLLHEYYNNKVTFADADVLSVVIGTPLDNINATLDHGVAISGRVTDVSSGAGLAGILVNAQAVVCCQGIAGTTTGADGTYSFVVPPGSYKVGFFPPSTSDYLYEFYENTRDFNAATVVVVGAAPVGGIDGALDRAVRVTGRVTGPDGLGVSGVSVNLERTTDCEWLAGAGTGSDGTYVVLVQSGSYKMSFSPPPGSVLLGERYNNKGNCADADVVTAVVGTPLNIDAALEGPHDVAQPKIDDARVVGNFGLTDFGDANDSFTLLFSEPMNTSTIATLQIQDQDGTLMTLRCGATPNEVACDWSAEGSVLAIAVTSGLSAIDDFGSTPGFQIPFNITALPGLTDLAGNTMNILGSPDRLVDYESTDTTGPTFTSMAVSGDVVTVTFGEPVCGTYVTTDWRIQNISAGATDYATGSTANLPADCDDAVTSFNIFLGATMPPGAFVEATLLSGTNTKDASGNAASAPQSRQATSTAP